MKTKLLLTAILLFSFLNSAFSQQYHPLLNHTSWTVLNSVSCCRPTIVATFSPENDTIACGHTYTKYNDPFPQNDSNAELIHTIYIRENVSERKVYKLVEGVDTLLYDFGMENGDTITQYGYNWTATVDEVAVIDGMRKRITLHAPYNPNHTVTQIWIEGVGTNKHPFYPNQNMLSFMSSGGGVMINNACVYQNGVHIYGENDYCSAIELNTTSDAFLNQKIVFSPNPVSTELTINSELALQNATFQLYDSEGKLIREVSNLKGYKMAVNRENLPKGVYVAQLSEKGKLVKTGKIILN